MRKNLLHSVITITLVAVAALTTQLGGASAQDGPQAPTGKLVVVPGAVEVGETALAVGFHVVPRDIKVAIEYSEHFAPVDEPCNTSMSGSAPSAVAPTWAKLKACSVGEGRVRLVASSTGHVIEDVSVRVSAYGSLTRRAQQDRRTR